MVCAGTVTLTFQLTTSLRRPTRERFKKYYCNDISTHDLLAEADDRYGTGRDQAEHFNSRPPCGGRLDAAEHASPVIYFNSRPPCGGRPGSSTRRISPLISTHDLLAEADLTAEKVSYILDISTHDLLAEADRK